MLAAEMPSSVRACRIRHNCLVSYGKFSRLIAQQRLSTAKRPSTTCVISTLSINRYRSFFPSGLIVALGEGSIDLAFLGFFGLDEPGIAAVFLPEPVVTVVFTGEVPPEGVPAAFVVVDVSSAASTNNASSNSSSTGGPPAPNAGSSPSNGRDGTTAGAVAAGMGLRFRFLTSVFLGFGVGATVGGGVDVGGCIVVVVVVVGVVLVVVGD